MSRPFPELDVAIVRSGEHKYVIAARARVSPNIFGMILSGRHAPTAGQRRRIAAALGRPESELFRTAVIA